MLGLKCLCFGEEPRHPPPPPPPAAAGRGQCWAVRCWCRGHPSGAPGSGTLPCAAPAAGQPRPRGDRALAPLLLLNSRLRASLLWHYRAPVFLARVRLGHVRTRRRGGGVEGVAAGRGRGHRGVVTPADPLVRPRAWRPLTEAQSWGGGRLRGRGPEREAPRGPVEGQPRWEPRSAGGGPVSRARWGAGLHRAACAGGAGSSGGPRAADACAVSVALARAFTRAWIGLPSLRASPLTPAFASPSPPPPHPV